VTVATRAQERDHAWRPAKEGAILRAANAGAAVRTATTMFHRGAVAA
jgi:hypothetical protein